MGYKEIGRKIFYDKVTGEIIVDTGERSGDVVETTIEYDISVYKELAERVRDTFDVIQLEYRQYAEDFANCTGYIVDVETKELIFSYDGGTEEVPPVFQKPLTDKVKELESQVSTQEQAIAELSSIVGSLMI